MSAVTEHRFPSLLTGVGSWAGKTPNRQPPPLIDDILAQTQGFPTYDSDSSDSSREKDERRRKRRQRYLASTIAEPSPKRQHVNLQYDRPHPRPLFSSSFIVTQHPHRITEEGQQMIRAMQSFRTHGKFTCYCPYLNDESVSSLEVC